MTAAGTTALLNILAYIALALAGLALMMFLGDRLFCIFQQHPQYGIIRFTKTTEVNHTETSQAG